MKRAHQTMLHEDHLMMLARQAMLRRGHLTTRRKAHPTALGHRTMLHEGHLMMLARQTILRRGHLTTRRKAHLTVLGHRTMLHKDHLMMLARQTILRRGRLTTLTHVVVLVRLSLFSTHLYEIQLATTSSTACSRPY